MTTTRRNMKSYKCAEAILAYSFVKLNASGELAQCGANEKHIGIAQGNVDYAIGDVAEVALIGGGAELKITETVAVQKYLTPTSTGLGEVVDAANEVVGAIAMESGVANQIIAVEVVHFVATATDA